MFNFLRKKINEKEEAQILNNLKSSFKAKDANEVFVEKVVSNIKTKETQTGNTFNFNKAFRLAGAAAVVAIVAVISVSILPIKKNSSDTVIQKINSSNPIIQKASAAVLEQGKILDLVVSYKFGEEEGGFKNEYLFDMVNKKGVMGVYKKNFRVYINNGTSLEAYPHPTKENPAAKHFTYTFYNPKDAAYLTDLVLINYRELLTSAEAQDIGKSNFQGKEVYAVTLTPGGNVLRSQGLREILFYFDEATYLPTFIKFSFAGKETAKPMIVEATVESQMLDLTEAISKKFEAPSVSKNDIIEYHYDDLNLAKSKLRDKGLYFIGDDFIGDESTESTTGAGQVYLTEVRQETRAGEPEARVVSSFYYDPESPYFFRISPSIGYGNKGGMSSFMVKQVDLSYREQLDFDLQEHYNNDHENYDEEMEKEWRSRKANRKQIKVDQYDVFVYREQYDYPIHGRSFAQFVKDGKFISIDGFFNENDLPKIIESLKTY